MLIIPMRKKLYLEVNEMLKHIFKGLAISLILISMTVFAAAPVLAFDSRTGDTVNVPHDEVVDGDLYVMGRNIIIDGTVNGDVFGAGQTITINGTVNGGVTLAGQTLTVNGQVANGARLAGQTINVSSSIGRDLVAAGATLNVTSTAKIADDLIFGFGTSYISGNINGNVKGGASEVTITNGVGGDVKVEVDKLTITSTANIEGDLVYTSENEANIQSGARVGGSTIHNMPEKPAPAPFAGMGGKLLGFIMILVVGIIVILLAPRWVSAMADSIRAKPWPSLGWGALVLFATPIAAIIVIITIIGLPVGLIALVLYGIAIYLSQIPVGFLIGRLIIRRNGEIESRGLMVGALALGLAILLVLGLIPYIGGLVMLLTIIFGLGSVVVSVIRSRARA
jgi:cytoskeletal protein CcmA (bactofilin family)